jgi:hypothetical protein
MPDVNALLDDKEKSQISRDNNEIVFKTKLASINEDFDT